MVAGRLARRPDALPDDLRLGGVQLVALVLFGAYALVVPLPATRHLSVEARSVVYNLRPYVFVGIVGFLLAWTLLFARRRLTEFVKSDVGRRPWIMATVASLFMALALTFRRDPAPAAAALHLLWGAVTFFLVPVLIRRRRDIVLWATLLAVVSGIQWGAAWVWSSTHPTVESLFAGRRSYGFANPNYYSQIVQVLGVGVITLRVLRERRGWRVDLVVLAVVAFGLWVAWGAASRNILAFAVGAASVYWILSGGRSRAWWSMTAVTLAGGAMIFWLLTSPPLARWDEFSSRRLSIWANTLSWVASRPDPLMTVLVGTDEAPPEAEYFRYDEAAAEKQFNKYHVDNFYLEHFVEGGVVGLGLILIPYAYLLHQAVRGAVKDVGNRRAYAWLASLIGGILVQGLFVATIPSFNSPLGIMCAVSMSWVGALMAERPRPTPKPRRSP